MNFSSWLRQTRWQKLLNVFVFTNVRIIIFKSVVTYANFGFSFSIIFNVSLHSTFKQSRKYAGHTCSKLFFTTSLLKAACIVLPFCQGEAIHSINSCAIPILMNNWSLNIGCTLLKLYYNPKILFLSSSQPYQLKIRFFCFAAGYFHDNFCGDI